METLDILRGIDDEELNYIVKRLEDELPYTIQDLYFVIGAIRHKALAKNHTDVSERLLPVFYVHRDGSKENCTVFGITCWDVDAECYWLAKVKTLKFNFE